MGRNRAKNGQKRAKKTSKRNRNLAKPGETESFAETLFGFGHPCSVLLHVLNNLKHCLIEAHRWVSEALSEKCPRVMQVVLKSFFQKDITGLVSLKQLLVSCECHFPTSLFVQEGPEVAQLLAPSRLAS